MWSDGGPAGILAPDMYYGVVVFLHIASVLALLATHGVSMVVLYRIRTERDRGRSCDFVTLSGETTLPMYIALGGIVVFGVLAGLEGQWFDEAWIWVSIVLLLVIVGLMTAVAKPYFARMKEACQVRPSGVPRVSDEELGRDPGGANGPSDRRDRRDRAARHPLPDGLQAEHRLTSDTPPEAYAGGRGRAAGPLTTSPSGPEPRPVARAVEGLLGRVPSDRAPDVRAAGRDQVELAVSS